MPTAGVLGAGAGFLPARENRSSAWACTRKEPCACETRGRKDTVRELLGAAAGFFPARENRSSVRACTWNQPRACAVQMQTQTRCASCPAQPRGEEADRANRFVGSRHTTSCIAGDEPAGADRPGRRVRELPTAGAGAVRGHAPGTSRVRARLGKATNRVRELPAAGARLARRSRAGEKVLRNFAGKGLTIRTSYIIINNAPQ